MNTKNLLHFFSFKTDLPIDTNEVAAKIASYGMLEVVEFVGVSLDEKRLKGAFNQYTCFPGVYALPAVKTEIFYVNTDDSKWKRLVCCKELLHLLDDNGAKSETREHVSDLIKNMCGAMPILADANLVQTFTDHAMVLYAMALLLPFRARELMLPDYKSGRINDDIISEWVDLPPEVVHIVMSDGWPGLYNILSGK